MSRHGTSTQLTALARIAALMLALFAVAALSVRPALAQAPPPPGDGRPPVVAGDVVWAFAQENPLFDSRIAGALGTTMAPRIEAASPAGARIVRVEEEPPGTFPSGTIYPAGDVPLLLAAAGYGDTPPFIEVGRCKVWASTADDATATSIRPSEAAPIVTTALHDALAALGVTTQPCAITTDPAQAHVLVWVAYGSAPAFAQRGQPTFLGSAAPPPPPSAPGGTGGGPRPAITGTGGLAREVDARPHVLAALALGALCMGARMLTRREARA